MSYRYRLDRLDSHGIGAYDFDLAFNDALVLLHGPNGCGKTSIIRAVQIGVWGFVPELGKGKTHQIFRAGTEPRVRLVFIDESTQRKLTITRVMKESGQTIDVSPSRGERTNAEKQNRIQDEIGMPVAQVDVGAFMDLTPAKRAMAMAALVRSDDAIDADAVIGALEERGVPGELVGKAVCEAWEDGQSVFENIDRVDRVFVATTSASAVSTRQDQERLKQVCSEVVTQIPETTADLNEQRKEVEARIAAITVEHAVARERAAAISAAEDRVARAVARRERLRKEIDDHQQQLGNLRVIFESGGRLPIGRVPTANDLEALVAEVDRLADELTVLELNPEPDQTEATAARWKDAQERLHAARARVKAIDDESKDIKYLTVQEVAANLVKIRDGTWNHEAWKWVADLATKSMQGLAAQFGIGVMHDFGHRTATAQRELHEAIQAAEAQTLAMQRARDHRNTMATTIAAKRDTLYQRKDALREGRMARDSLAGRISVLEAVIADGRLAIEQAERDVSDAQAERVAMPEPADMRAGDEELGALRTRQAYLIDRGIAKSKDLARRTEQARLENAIASGTARANAFRAASVALRAISGDLVAQVSTGFVGAANAVLAWEGRDDDGVSWRLRSVVRDGGIAFDAVKPTGEVLPFGALSSGQQARFICAVAAGLCSMNEGATRMLFIDASRMDGAALRDLLTNLRHAEIKGLFDTILVEHCNGEAFSDQGFAIAVPLEAMQPAAKIS